MGWNDHVEMVRRQCLACGEEGEWEIWNEVALARYSGGLDKLLGHDAENHNRCPYCGSHEGEDVDEDDDIWLSEDDDYPREPDDDEPDEYVDDEPPF